MNDLPESIKYIPFNSKTVSLERDREREREGIKSMQTWETIQIFKKYYLLSIEITAISLKMNWFWLKW